MRPSEIDAQLRQRPFTPFRLCMTDGTAYEVRHPEMMLVTRSEVVIAMDPGDDQIPERSAYLDPVHITRIEPIDGETPP
ncbi:MAG: hypothetical protein IH988_02475 [Planctomycetes bacterium]|nr:hypothetical protein [Planctomycetota bacterium]